MATLIHLGNVAASATGHGGLGVVSLGPQFNPTLPPGMMAPEGLDTTSLPEAGAYFTRVPAQLSNGTPNRVAAMACHTRSLVNFGVHVAVDSLNPRPLDVAMSSDQRWVAGHGSFAVTGPDAHGNYVTTWGSAVGAGATLAFAVQAGEEAANPTTGILVDPLSQFWSRIGQLTLPTVVDDQNPGLLTLPDDPVTKLTVMLVATPQETDWYFGDLLSFYDAGVTDPVAAKLACLRMEADELQLWVRGQRYTERIVNPWSHSIDIGQQLDGRRPIIVGWSIDASAFSETGQAGRGSLVVIDPHSSTGIDYSFANRYGDTPLSNLLLLGKIGAASPISNPFNPQVIEWLMRLDIYELNLWQEALDLDELLTQAAKLDSIYGIVQ